MMDREGERIILDKIGELLIVSTRCQTLLDEQKADIRDIKDENEKRWRDHETRVRILEVSTMKSEDILKLTTSNSERITALEKENRTMEGMKLGISKTTALVWGAVAVLLGQIGHIITFIKSHI